MAVAVRRVRRRRPYGTIFVLGLLAVGLAWVLIPLSRGEAIPDPRALLERFLSPDVVAAATSRKSSGPAPGKVRVFVSGREIPAYSKILRDDLWNAEKGTWAYSDVDESIVESSGVVVDVTDIVGRVLAHRKSAGYVFTEKDFLPEGTRPGLSAGVPAGKRALRIDVDKVQGIVGLQPGDRFDMVAALSLDVDPASRPAFAGVYSSLLQRQAQMNNYRRARVQVLVQNGVVVTPLETRQVPITNSSLTRGTTVRTIPKQEMVIALDPAEVAPFMESLSVDAQITCLARSGRPDDVLDSLTPSSEPDLSLWAPYMPGQVGQGGGAVTIIESIDDQQRSLMPVPGGASSGEPR